VREPVAKHFGNYPYHQCPRVLTIPRFDIVVELIGGYKLQKILFSKPLNKANMWLRRTKRFLAIHGEEIYAAAEKAGVVLGYEASVAGGIPVLAAIQKRTRCEQHSSLYTASLTVRATTS